MEHHYLNPESLTDGNEITVRRVFDPPGWPLTVDDYEICHYVISVVKDQGDAKVICETEGEVHHLMRIMEEIAVARDYRKVTYYAS